jgi:hypothetical protein
MPRGKPEQAEHVIPKLREVEVALGRGKTVAEAVKKIGSGEKVTTKSAVVGADPPAAMLVRVSCPQMAGDQG